MEGLVQILLVVQQWAVLESGRMALVGQTKVKPEMAQWIRDEKEYNMIFGDIGGDDQ